MKNTLIFLALVFLITIVPAQQLQTGEVHYPEYGIQFTIPQGWFGKETSEGYAMQSKSLPGIIMLFVNESNTIKAIEADFSESIIEENLNLQPNGEMEISSNYVKQYYNGTADTEKVNVLAYGYLNPYGKSVTMMVMSKAIDFSNDHESMLLEIKNSLKFSEPAVNKNFNAAICKRDLSGKRLKYEKYTYSGGSLGGVSGSYSISREINLCSSGSFTYYGGSNMSVESESSHGHNGGNSEGHGSWEFVNEDCKVYLVLRYLNEEVRYYEVTYDKQGGTYLDDTRYYISETSCN